MMDIKKRYRLVGIGFIVMVVLNILILGSLWIIRPPLRDHRPEEPHIRHVLRHRLNLTEKQEARFHELRENYRLQTKTVVRQIGRNRRLLYDAIVTADSVQTDSLAALIAEGHKELETINVRHFRKLRTLLNKEQQQKFDGMLHKMAGFSTRRLPVPQL